MMLPGRQIVDDNTIEHEVDEDKIHAITSSGAGGGSALQSALQVGVPSDRDVAPGVNAPLLQVQSAMMISSRLEC